MALTSYMRPVDHRRFMLTADWLAVAVAVALPWSTSATAIFSTLWLLALLPTLDWADLRRELVTPAGGLPVLLVALGVLGVAWADVDWHARWGGVSSFFRLLLIPLLFAQFRRSERGMCVLTGYLVSCIILLPITSVVHGHGKIEDVFVKNGATQSEEFVICIFCAMYLAFDWLKARAWWKVAAFAAVTLGMLGNMVFIATGRTALVVIPVLLVLFAWKRLSGEGMAILFAAVIVVGAIGWFSSPYLRYRTTELWTGFYAYWTSDANSSSGERFEFYRKSLIIIRQAPILGHGTGTITKLFGQLSSGDLSIASGTPTTNPHNQTFAVAIQVGLVGAAVLWAMWIAHLMLFRGDGLAAWVGLVIVAQNIVGSLFNSHLFDFDQAWIYVLGVGVAGGMVLKARAAATSVGATPSSA